MEPNEAMIGGFKKVLPDTHIFHGAAQDLPFGDGSIDAVFVGQVTLNCLTVDLLNHAQGEACPRGSSCPHGLVSAKRNAPLTTQGFHWFAHEEALREIHRVLRPGGGVALLWNREDDGVPWAAELLGVFEPLSRGIPQYWTGDWVRVWEGHYAQQHFDVPQQDPRSRSRFFR